MECENLDFSLVLAICFLIVQNPCQFGVVVFPPGFRASLSEIKIRATSLLGVGLWGVGPDVF